jgi:hypothetical protein
MDTWNSGSLQSGSLGSPASIWTLHFFTTGSLLFARRSDQIHGRI